MKNTRLNQLDGLRGIFCLMVILTHFPYKDSLLVSNFIVRQGYLFVDFFFVLSGFVISFNYYNRIKTRGDLTDYLRKRFLRLYPLLLYTVIIYLLFEVIFVLWFPQLLNHKETIGSLLYLTADSLTFLNSTKLLGENLGMNYPTWSISAEMIAYIVFGLTILLSAKKKLISFILLLITCMAFLALRKTYMVEGDWGFIRGIFCFIMGTLSFVFFQKYQAIKLNRYFEYVSPVILIMIFYIRHYYFEKNGFLAGTELFTLFIVPLFFATAIFIYAISDGLLVRFLCNRFFQFIGRISYSIYLNHAIVLILVVRSMFSILKIPENEFSIAISLLISVVATIIYSYFTFLFIEKKGKKILEGLIVTKT